MISPLLPRFLILPPHDEKDAPVYNSAADHVSSSEDVEVEQVTRGSMEELIQAHTEGYASSMISVTFELETFIVSDHDCTDFKDIYKALSTSTDVNPQHIYPEYYIGQDGPLRFAKFDDGKSIRTCVSSSQ